MKTFISFNSVGVVRSSLVLWGLLLSVKLCGAQATYNSVLGDSIVSVSLQEVVVIGTTKSAEKSLQHKLLAGVENYLESMPSVGMVKRGAYAWEPTINNMNTERINVTIDGMKIFGACTDKMDPVTSYVEVSNLSKAEVSSGQHGSHMGNSIGGSMNLVVDKSEFGTSFQKLNLETGFESNNELQIMGFDTSWANERFFVDVDAMRREAKNYTAGGGIEQRYSQYQKFNISMNSGIKLTKNASLSSSFIYDQANDVGYPALPMDVSLAKALLTSVSYFEKKTGDFTQWESKIYMNRITHVMDDSQRPEVPIRMDMPGSSDTYGAYSQIQLLTPVHHWQFKWDAYLNNSYAEMTMYPKDPTEKAMFMLTWPDVLSMDSGIFVGDQWKFSQGSLNLSARLNAHQSRIQSEMGLSSLQIFFPEMSAFQWRLLSSVAADFQYQEGAWHYQLGVGWGNRAPSVSEAYGFYLFNSFDNHDYIGNPLLKNESSFEGNVSTSYQGIYGKFKVHGSYFYMPNYIIGKVDRQLSKMTFGADGVKRYVNLDQAQLISLGAEFESKIHKGVKIFTSVSYHRAYDSQGENLPFIAPFEYRFESQCVLGSVLFSSSVQGAATQKLFNASYGEDATPSYQIVNASASKRIYIGANSMKIKMGIENMLDTYYTTYADWNNLPRMGRNLFINLSYQL